MHSASQPGPPARTGRGRRNRHGRGLRGPLLPPGLPGRRTRAQRFDVWLAEGIEDLAERYGEDVHRVRFGHTFIPDQLEDRLTQLNAWGAEAVGAPLGQVTHAPDGTVEITLFRGVVEQRFTPHSEQAVVFNALVQQWHRLTGVRPEDDEQD